MALTKVTGQVIKNTTDVTVGVLTVTNTLAVGGTVSIGGTLTYEDVTNVDAVGLITARNGIVVGSGITLSVDGDIFATGVCTATSFVGSGANLTGVASTENIRTNTNATFLQNVNVSGTTTVAGNINANGNIVGDDSTNISGMNDVIATSLYTSDSIIHRGEVGDNTKIRFPSDDTISFETDGNEVLRITSGSDIVTSGLTDHSVNNDGSNTKVLEVSGGGGTGTYGVLNLSGNQNSSAVVGAIKFCNRENSNSSSGSNANSRRLASIDCFADTSDSNGGDDCGGYMRFVTKSDGGGGSERMRVTSSGNDEITDGDLKISTSGHGIDFSATSDSTGTTQSEILDDYEEGTWTPTIAYSSSGSATLSEALGFYTKIGRMVYVQFDITWPTTSSASAAGFTLPMNLTVSYGTGNIGWTDNGSPLFIHVGGYAYVMDNNSSNNSSQHYLNSQLSGKRIIGNLWYIS